MEEWKMEDKIRWKSEIESLGVIIRGRRLCRIVILFFDLKQPPFFLDSICHITLLICHLLIQTFNPTSPLRPIHLKDINNIFLSELLELKFHEFQICTLYNIKFPCSARMITEK